MQSAGSATTHHKCGLSCRAWWSAEALRVYQGRTRPSGANAHVAKHTGRRASRCNKGYCLPSKQRPGVHSNPPNPPGYPSTPLTQHLRKLHTLRCAREPTHPATQSQPPFPGPPPVPAHTPTSAARAPPACAPGCAPPPPPAAPAAPPPAARWAPRRQGPTAAPRPQCPRWPAPGGWGGTACSGGQGRTQRCVGERA